MSKKTSKFRKKNYGGSRGYKPKGDEESLGTNIFDYGRANNQNQYNKTLEAVISFIGRTYSQPGNIIKSIRKLQKLEFPPVLTPDYASEAGKKDDELTKVKAINRAKDLEFVDDLKERKKKVQVLKDNAEAVFSLVWGQCTPAIQAQIKTMGRHDTIRDHFQLFELLKEIKGHTFKLTDRDYPYQSIWDSYLTVFTTKQNRGEFLDKFQERFNVIVEAAEGYGCRFGSEEVLWERDRIWSNLTEDEREIPREKKEVQERYREKLLVYGCTSGLGERFDAYKKDLRANYSQGNNK